MKKLTCTILLLGFFTSSVSLAQDEILKKNGESIKSQVVEVGTNEVKYKKWENKNGPTYSMNKSDIFMIKYENGSKDVFGDNESKPTNTAQTPAVIYFFRPNKFAGSGPEIIVGTIEPDEVIVHVHNGRWFRKDYSHFGERSFVAGVFAINPESFNFLIEPGKTYYVRCTLYSKGFKQMAQLEMVDESVAKSEMNSLKEQTKPK